MEAIPEDRRAPGRGMLMMTMAIYILDVFYKGLKASSWEIKHKVAVDSGIADLQREVNIGLFTGCRRAGPLYMEAVREDRRAPGRRS